MIDLIHGTIYAYSTHGCRCDKCRAGHSQRCKSYRLRRHKAGGTSTLVDATPAAEILRDLKKRMSYQAIADAIGAGSSHSWVRDIVSGRRNRISPARLAAIRALGDVQPRGSVHVRALGARRRIQALHAMGYPLAQLSRETGYSLSGMKAVVHGRWPVIEADNDHKIREVYDRLAMVLPVGNTKHERGAITRARANARTHGWPPPLAWEDIDDPDEQPTIGTDNNSGGGLPWAELIEEWEFLTESCGLSKTDALARLGVSDDALRQAMKKRAAAEAAAARPAMEGAA